MPFLLAEILNFQGSTHRIGVGSFSQVIVRHNHLALCAALAIAAQNRLLVRQKAGAVIYSSNKYHKALPPIFDSVLHYSGLYSGYHAPWHLPELTAS